MKVEPSAADLLDIARATILAQVAPSLPEAQRYAALMAANALAIAARDLAAQTTAAAEIARIVALLAGWTPAGDESTALREGTALLATRIRAGRYDEGEARQRLLEHLRETTRARLAVSNPRAMAREPTTTR
ncbi:MAG TPA: DUF6285 domain-containing protein [Usitatibacteraceae bacterium]|nr:DUF6285 domain-containing protein [Usitatibacteraceae bacterium]